MSSHILDVQSNYYQEPPEDKEQRYSVNYLIMPHIYHISIYKWYIHEENC